MASMRSEVLGGFRRLMRARLDVFKTDTAAVNAAREQLRVEFNKNRDETDPNKIASLVKGIKDVEEMLNFNVIQGKKNERGSYVVKLSSQQSEAMGSHTEISHVDANAGDLPDKVETTVSSTPGVKKEA